MGQFKRDCPSKNYLKARVMNLININNKKISKETYPFQIDQGKVKHSDESKYKV